ncbi:IclR family transcriptional regulator [Aromatoleum buckelii]|uniref:Helix-turn-helix domain-containing protein n=1 Tax=Aromatoleum buckelii TaxID=200254 RepID=A0ABX1N1Y9_9RHOO|nr:IclR family transcriptional regulator [Aromatoleum buckelii]MCK0513027.1 IclR family transcriptional regulator [Aromatoleum buckelii]
MKQASSDPFQNRSATWPNDEFDDDESPDVGGEDVRVLRALNVLEQLSASANPVTLAVLAHRLRVPKPTLMRLLRAMEIAGYVLRGPAASGFVAGPRAAALALRTLRGPDLRRHCRSILRRLVNRLGETCNLTVPDGARVLYVERVETSEPLRLHLTPGSWVPLHCTASGKLFLASMSLLERRRTLAHLPLTRAAPRTLVDRDALDTELDRLVRLGIGVDNEEFVRGMIAVAVPVFDKDRKVVAAVACHAPTARLSLDELLTCVPHLRTAADEMTSVLSPAVTSA